MFNNAEKRLILKNYFKVIRQTENYYELESICTQHRWIIQKVYLPGKLSVRLYHKHTADIPYYHKHKTCFNVMAAIKEIRAHDEYVLSYQSK